MKLNIISSLILGSAAMLAVSSAQAVYPFIGKDFTIYSYNPNPHGSAWEATKEAEAIWAANRLLGDGLTLVPGSAGHNGAYMYQIGVATTVKNPDLSCKDGGNAWLCGSAPKDDRLMLSSGWYQSHWSGSYGAVYGKDNPTGTGGNAALSALIADTPTYDQMTLTFEFTVDPWVTAITASFIFASDEFGSVLPNNDVFALWIDGKNYALLPDGSVVSVHNIGDNWVDGKDYGYKGRTEEIWFTALLDPTLATHTITIAIADATNGYGLSTVFLSQITAVPEPETWAMLLAGLGLVGVTAKRRRQK